MTVETTNTPTKKDNPKNNVRSERSSQTDDKEQQPDEVKLCFDKFKHVEDKLDKVLLILSEFDHLKARVSNSKKKKQSTRNIFISCGKT